MTASRVENLSSSSRVGVSWSDGSDPAARRRPIRKESWRPCIFFLRRVFAMSEVAWVEIDRNLFGGIDYDAGRLKLPEFLQLLAVAFRGSRKPSCGCAIQVVLADLERATSRLRIKQFGPALTTWDIIHDRPGRIRLRRQAIRRDPAVASRLHDTAEGVPGVTEVEVRPVTGSVLIRFDPESTSALDLLRTLDQARDDGMARRLSPPTRSPPASGWPTHRWLWRSPVK